MHGLGLEHVGIGVGHGWVGLIFLILLIAAFITLASSLFEQ